VSESCSVTFLHGSAKISPTSSSEPLEYLYQSILHPTSARPSSTYFPSPPATTLSSHHNLLVAFEPVSDPRLFPVAMAAPTNTLLIEGTFEELAEELAQYIDSLRKSPAEGASLHSEVAALVKEDKKDEVLKKIVGSAQLLNTAPEKGDPSAVWPTGRVAPQPTDLFSQPSYLPTILSSTSPASPPTQISSTTGSASSCSSPSPHLRNMAPAWPSPSSAQCSISFPLMMRLGTTSSMSF
jgi:hypothetical protein